MQLGIAREIAERHPDVLVGGVVASNLRAATATVAGQPFPEDRLGRVGLDVFGPRREVAEGVRDDGDLIF